MNFKNVDGNLVDMADKYFAPKSEVVKLKAGEWTLEWVDKFRNSEVADIHSKLVTFRQDAEAMGLDFNILDAVYCLVITTFSNVPNKPRTCEELIQVTAALVDLELEDDTTLFDYIISKFDKEDVQALWNKISKISNNKLALTEAITEVLTETKGK